MYPKFKVVQYVLILYNKVLIIFTITKYEQQKYHIKRVCIDIVGLLMNNFRDT